jgi:ribulose-phosphate 3-epimerase
MGTIKKIAPSVMCAPLFQLDSCLAEMESCGTDLLHIDIMDGNFVQNFTLGTDFVKQLKSRTKLPLDIHLMITDPEKKLEWFVFGEGDYVSVHYEASSHLNKALGMIRQRGAKAMVAINPATPISALDSVLEDIDAVLVMTVNPGFAGQKLIGSTLNKIRRLRRYLDDAGYSNIEIEVDGNVSFENAKLMSEAGADIFVAGSSSVFSKEASLTENTQKLREMIELEKSVDMSNPLWYKSENRIPVLGHRGIKAKYAENTLRSFEAAIKLGVDLIEFDVNITADGVPVVIHDNSIDRTSDHTGLVRDYTLAQLKSFDFGCKFGPEFAGATIPTLEEVLSLASSYPELLLNVEIKDMTHEAVDKTISMLKRFGLEDRSVIASFDAEIIRYTKKAYPHMRCQGFPGRYMQNFTEDTYDVMFGIGIPIGWKGCTDESIRADVAFAKSKGILAWLFCADTEEDVRRCVEYDCDNITGNDPEVALRVLRQMKLHK